MDSATLALVVEDESGVVVDCDGDTVLESNSIQKLFTAGAALLELGPDCRFTTRVLGDGDDLVLVASGDPTFAAADLDHLCSAVAAAGVRRVGAVVVDDGRYDRLRSAPAWKDYYVPGFTGPLSAFVLDRNRYRRDAAYVTDPTGGNAGRVVDALQAAGIEVADGWRVGTASGTASGTAAPVAEHASAPLRDIVRDMVCASDSFTAELLTKELGARHGNGSTAGGIGVIEAVAARLGVPRAPSGSAADGSGLAASTTDTARRQVAWLRALEATPVASDFRRCLPVAGESGTVAGRFVGTPAAGAVAAKTGTRRLHATANLVGYAATTRGTELCFAMTITGASSLEAAVEAVDALVLGLVEP